MTLGTSEAPRFRPSIRPLFLAPRRLVGRTSHPTSYSQTQTQTSTHVVHPHLHLQSPSKEFQAWIGSVQCSDLQHHSNRVNDILFSTASLRPSIPLSSSSSFARVSPSAQTANSARSADSFAASASASLRLFFRSPLHFPLHEFRRRCCDDGNLDNGLKVDLIAASHLARARDRHLKRIDLTGRLAGDFSRVDG